MALFLFYLLLKVIWVFFVKMCSFWARFFECASLFLHLIFLRILYFVEFSFQTRVKLIFRLYYLFWACFSNLLIFAKEPVITEQ